MFCCVCWCGNLLLPRLLFQQIILTHDTKIPPSQMIPSNYFKSSHLLVIPTCCIHRNEYVLSKPRAGISQDAKVCISYLDF